MTNAMQIFNNPAFGEIRTTTIKGEPWIAGRDVCLAFGDTNPNRSLGRIDDEDKMRVTTNTAGGAQEMTFINESGLYALLFAMQPAKAHKGGTHMTPPSVQERIDKLHAFKRWVTHDVLPSIRKYGGYSVKATNAEARLLREQNRAKKLDAVFLSELRRAKPDDRPIVLEVLRRNGINVPEEAKKPAPEPDIDFQAALEVLRRVGESAGTYKRHWNNEYLCIPAPEARDALNGQGFDPRAVFDFARSAGMLRTGKKGYSFTACINGLPVNCLWIASALMNANA